MTAAVGLFKRRLEVLRRRLRDTRSVGGRIYGDDALKSVHRMFYDHLEEEIRFTEEAIILLESLPTTD